MNPSSSNPHQNNNNYPNPNPLPKKKSTSGRRKLPMEKIKNETNRQVTFSKRKGGLVKKASELSTLTGIEIALVVFSPGGKAYSYGNPSLERVTSRWMYANAYTHEQRAPSSAMQEAIFNRQNEEITESEAELEVQRNRRTELMSMETASLLSGAYPPDLKTLRSDEICTLIASIRGFENSFEAKAKEAKDIAAAPKSLKAPQHCLLERGQCSSHVVQQNQMVHGVFHNNVINDYAYPNQGKHTQQRGQRFSDVIGSSSPQVAQQNQVGDCNKIAHEVFVNHNRVNDNVNPNNQGMYTGRFFNPGGFASYNPSSLRFGGSSSFAFPSGNNANAGHLASGSAIHNIEVLFGDMSRFQSHVPDLVTPFSPACDGNDVLPKEDVAGEEKYAALGKKFYWR